MAGIFFTTEQAAEGCCLCSLACRVLCLVTQLCPILHNPMDCSRQGYSVHGDSPSQNAGMGCHALLQGIFPTQGLQADSLPLGRLGSPTQHHECGKYHRIRRSKCLIPCYAHPPQWWSTPGPAFSPRGFSPPSFLLTVHLFTEPPVSPSPLSVRGGTVLRCLYLQPSWGEMCSELLSSQLSRPSPAPGAEEKER